MRFGEPIEREVSEEVGRPAAGVGAQHPLGAYEGRVSEQAITALTLEEFLAWEERQPTRHEYVGGRTAPQLTWATLGPGDQLDTPYGVWDLDAIYDQVDADATA